MDSPHNAIGRRVNLVRQDTYFLPGGMILPPTFSHVPFATYFQSYGLLSAFAWPAQLWLPSALAQSLAPALATPKHFSLLALSLAAAAGAVLSATDMASAAMAYVRSDFKVIFCPIL